MVACCRSPVTRTSVTVTKPSRGSLSRRSIVLATMTLIWSAIWRARVGAACAPESGLPWCISFVSGPEPVLRPYGSCAIESAPADPFRDRPEPGATTGVDRCESRELGSVARPLLHLEGLDDVTDAQNVVLAEAGTAIAALADPRR